MFHSKSKYLTILKDLKSCFKFKIDNYFTTLVLPVVVMVVFLIVADFVLVKLLGQPPLGVGSHYTLFEKIKSIFISPIIEEIVYRGLVLGALFIFLPKLIEKETGKDFGKWKVLIIIFGLMFQALYFGYWHNHEFDIRALQGLIFGLFYVFSDRNLVPGIIAHVVNNGLLQMI